MTDLERRYRRLLALYPRAHREQHGEEMLDVLMSAAGDRTWPSLRDTADLLWNAMRLHARRVPAPDDGNVLAVVSLLGPIVMLAGATTALHELAWWVRSGSLAEIPLWRQAPDAPVWAVWPAVAVLVLFGKRRAAAVGAWLGTAGLVVAQFIASGKSWWYGADAGWLTLGAVTAAALTWARTPARELTARFAIPLLAASVGTAGALGVFAYGATAAEWARLLVLVAGVAAACRVTTRVGRRAAAVLLLPVMTALLGEITLFVRNVNDLVAVLIFSVLPLVLLVAPDRLRRLT